MSIYIIDYGMGNLLSVQRAIEECGFDAVISADPKDAEKATHLILPGVGAFEDGMKNLAASGWIEGIQKYVDTGKPLIGICLGMQLMMTTGYEGGIFKGLNLIEGEVVKLIARSNDEKIPHVGWNEVRVVNESSIFDRIEDESDFYFVHSYHVVPKNQEHILAVTDYCGSFVSVVNCNNVYGVQFHPEKSGKTGFKLLTNFFEL